MTANYRMQLVADLASIGAERWNALVRADAARRSAADPSASREANPFVAYAFLSALHETGCASAASGWTVDYFALHDAADVLVGAVPLYRKDHSYGEYVFDWAWADAYRRHGVDYYPKLLSAIPFTPVGGPRLIAADTAATEVLARLLLAHAEASDLSSLHVLFPDGDDEVAALEKAGCLRREGVQFHWTNTGFADFEAFVDSLERKRRKNIRAERRKVAEAGVTVRRVEGKDATDADWRFFARCYANTYRAHYSTPYLDLAFFRRIGRSMPEHLLLVIAEREGAGGPTPIASSLVVHNGDRLYGRYWGEVEHVPCLHFECAYYQPLEFCIERGIRIFEGGAQGEHKMARGFLPVKTRSLHWLAHPSFAEAIEHFLAKEAIGIGHYVDELNERDPFKHDAKAAPPD